MDGFEMDHDQLLAEILQDYDLLPRFPTHIDGKMLDHVWTYKELSNQYYIEVIRKCVNLSDHDGIKLSLSANARTEIARTETASCVMPARVKGGYKGGGGQGVILTLSGLTG
uniref:Uncharacterized protein n=1 Tax=Clytia hemisphaerica TaxID=252671 RepID=A0A7M5UR19_9CNID